MNDPREDRLPKWAQDQLLRLRAKVDELTDRISQMTNVETPTRVVVGPGDLRGEMPLLFAPTRERVRFNIGPESSPGEVWMDVRLLPTLGRTELWSIEIMASGPISFHPRVTNVARICSEV